MAEPEVRILGSAPEHDDVAMQGDAAEVVEVGDTGTADAPGEAVNEESAEPEKPVPRVTFVE